VASTYFLSKTTIKEKRREYFVTVGQPGLLFLPLLSDILSEFFVANVRIANLSYYLLCIVAVNLVHLFLIGRQKKEQIQGVVPL
jgi:hypothetical protein